MSNQNTLGLRVFFAMEEPDLAVVVGWFAPAKKKIMDLLSQPASMVHNLGDEAKDVEFEGKVYHLPSKKEYMNAILKSFDDAVKELYAYWQAYHGSAEAIELLDSSLGKMIVQIIERRQALKTA